MLGAGDPDGCERGALCERDLAGLAQLEQREERDGLLDAREAGDLAVEVEHAAPPENGRAKPRAVLSAELWTRLRLLEGVELHFDAGKFAPEVEGLLALRELAREVFRGRDSGGV